LDENQGAKTNAPARLLFHANLKESIMSATVAEVMTRDVTVIAPDDNVRQAAQMMADWNIGVLPVCSGRRLLGIVTDRDITVRAVPTGKMPRDIRVLDIMSDGVYWLFEDQTVGEALQHMSDVKIRRLPVVDRQSMELSGIVSIGDLAACAEMHVDDAIRDISTPAAPIRPAPH
jgi:CBS domain-containing protein